MSDNIPDSDQIEREKVVENATQAAIDATRWVPRARARILEGTVLRLRMEHNLSWEEIAIHPDMAQFGIKPSGVRSAYYRTVNPYIDPVDVKAHIQHSLARHNFISDLAVDMAIKNGSAGVMARSKALDTALKAESGVRQLLGLDAPKTLRLENGKKALESMASDIVISAEEIKLMQEADPVERPAGAVERRDDIAAEYDTTITETAYTKEQLDAMEAAAATEEEKEVVKLAREAEEFIQRFKGHTVTQEDKIDPSAKRQGFLKVA